MTAPKPDEITVEIRLDTDTTLTLTGSRRTKEHVRNMATRAATAIKGDGWQPSSEQVTVTTNYYAQSPHAPVQIPPKSTCCGAYMVEVGLDHTGQLFEISTVDHCPHCGTPQFAQPADKEF